MYSPIFILKRSINTPSIPIISSLNHDKTLTVINKGLNHPSLTSEVRNFLLKNQNLNYPYLFIMDEFNVPKGKTSHLFSDKYKPESQNKSDLMNIAGI